MGLDLKGYLRLFLFVSYGTQPLFRMMDIMQINIRREQPDFLLEQCVCMVDMEAVFCGKPVFFSSGPWKTAGKSLFAVNGKLSFCSLNDNVSGHIPGEYYKRKEACDDALFQEQILF